MELSQRTAVKRKGDARKIEYKSYNTIVDGENVRDTYIRNGAVKEVKSVTNLEQMFIKALNPLV